MKKLLKLLLGILILVAICVGGFNFLYQEKVENLYTKDIKQVYSNSKLRNENYSELKDIFVDVSEEEWKQVNLIRRAIKEVQVLSLDNIEETFENEIFVLDTGITYFYVKMRLAEYFEKIGNYYLLKDEYKQWDDNRNLFLIPYKGLFLISSSTEDIDILLKNIEIKNTDLIRLSEKKDSKKYGEVIIDLNENTVVKNYGVDGGIFTLDYKKDEFVIKTNLYVKGDIYNSLIDQPLKRKLTSYIGEDRIYLSSNKMGSLAFNLYRGYDKDTIENLDRMLSLFGVDIEGILNEVDGEIIIGVEDESFIIPLKSDKKVKKLFELFGDGKRVKKVKLNLTLKDKVVYSGSIKQADNPVEIENDEFLYGDISLGIIADKYKEDRTKIRGRVLEDSIEIEQKVNKEFIRKIINDSKKLEG